MVYISSFTSMALPARKIAVTCSASEMTCRHKKHLRCKCFFQFVLPLPSILSPTKCATQVEKLLFRKKDALDKRLIHCNFGWGGTANGYYYYGAFDLRNGPEAGYDGEDTSSSSDKYYDMELIVTYTNCP